MSRNARRFVSCAGAALIAVSRCTTGKKLSGIGFPTFDG
jgi:hypothetical protein